MAIDYGVIGCGGAGTNRHIPAVQANPRTSLSCVCDLDEGRVKSTADKAGVIPYTDVSEMVEAENLSAVSIATPPGTHRDIAAELIGKNVDILVEKPFAPDLAAAGAILEELTVDQKITEVNNQLFQPVVKRATATIDRGTIGEVEQVYTHSSIPDLEHFLAAHPDWITSLPASVFGENLPHWIYLTRQFMGDVEHVDIDVSATAPHPEIDLDEVRIQLTSKNSRGEIRMCVNSTDSNFVLVVGDSGSIMIDLDNRINYLMETPASPKDILTNNLLGALRTTAQTLERALTHVATVGLRKWPFEKSMAMADRAYSTDGHYQQITELVGPRPLTVTRSDIKNNVQTYEAIVNGIEEAK